MLEKENIRWHGDHPATGLHYGIILSLALLLAACAHAPAGTTTPAPGFGDVFFGLHADGTYMDYSADRREVRTCKAWGAWVACSRWW